MKTFPLHLEDDQHATIKRRAKAAGLSMRKYIIGRALDGKLPKHTKTSK